MEGGEERVRGQGARVLFVEFHQGGDHRFGASLFDGVIVRLELMLALELCHQWLQELISISLLMYLIGFKGDF